MDFDMIIYVGNLPLGLDEEQLKGHFQAFGEVQSITVMNDKYIASGQPRGYGYVEMPVKSQGEAAITGLRGTVIENHLISLVEALPLAKKDIGFVRYRHSTPRRREL